MSAANADVDARLSMVDLPARQDIVLYVSLVDSKLLSEMENQCSQRATRVVGGSNEPLLGENWEPVAHPRDLKAVQVRFTAVGVLTLQAG